MVYKYVSLCRYVLYYTFDLLEHYFIDYDEIHQQCDPLTAI